MESEGWPQTNTLSNTANPELRQQMRKLVSNSNVALNYRKQGKKSKWKANLTPPLDYKQSRNLRPLRLTKENPTRKLFTDHMNQTISKLPQDLGEIREVSRATRIRMVDENSEQTYATKARARGPNNGATITDGVHAAT